MADSIDHFEIDKSGSPQGPWTSIANPVPGGGAARSYDTPLLAGTTYYRNTGVTANGVRFPYNIVSATAISAGGYQWFMPFGDINFTPHMGMGHAVAVDAAGNLFAGGRGGGSVGNPGLSKYSPETGALVWAADGSSRFIWPNTTISAQGKIISVACDAAGDVYFVLRFLGPAGIGDGGNQDVYNGSTAHDENTMIAKVSGTTGVKIWSKAFYSNTSLPASTDQCAGVGLTVDSAGNVIVVGKFLTMNFGGGQRTGVYPAGSNMFVLKLAGSNGSYIWDKVVGVAGGFFSTLTGVVTDSSNNIYVTGTAPGTVNFGGGAINSIAQDTVVFAKLNSSGTQVFAKSFGAFTTLNSNNIFGAKSICRSPNGDITLAGNFAGEISFNGSTSFVSEAANVADVFFARFTSTGSNTWGRSVRGSNGDSDVANGVCSDADGNTVFTGVVYGAADFGSGSLPTATYGSIFLAKYSPTGSPIWAKSLSGNQPGNAVVSTLDRSLVFTGFFQGNVNFGSGGDGHGNQTVNPAGPFLVKYAP